MQATCTQCGQRIAIDDAKVPDRPFVVKCPKCQTQVKLPGKAPAGPAAAPPSGPAAPDGPSPASDEARAQMMAQVRRELAVTDGSSLGRAMVVLPDPAQAGAITLTLTRLGFHVETIEDATEAVHLLEQGIFNFVAAARTPASPGKGETFYQRLSRMAGPPRRKVFLCVVGNELKTGDSMQAFALLADLVVNPKDLAAIDGLIRASMNERNRLYKAFIDVRERHESSAS